MNTKLKIHLLAIFMLPICIIWSGYVLSTLWGWFLVPALGLPAISIPSAIGIDLVVSYMTHQYRENTNDLGRDVEMLIKGMVYSTGRPAVALFFGWIVLKFL